MSEIMSYNILSEIYYLTLSFESMKKYMCDPIGLKYNKNMITKKLWTDPE